MARDRIKVLIVDDHPVFREGLRQCLEARRELQVTAAVGGAEELWRAFRTHGRPQIILMDVEMPGQGGIELTQAVLEKHPEIRVIMLTAFSDSERVFAALKAGAVGYLLKNSSPDEIAGAVERAAEGEPLLSGEIAGRVLREFERERQEERYREQLSTLTPREEEILKLIATGESNREIGARLFISEQTVKNHVASIFRKLQVNDRTKAALLAVKLGLSGDSTS
ncbi:MAG: response regulator [Deltaproteobacteria bacterium]|nr:response regulator [Deltaproteobacteria bacterium]